ncbi:hypothetical protein [Streptomyces liliifuscus]|uniref:Uncharacterized protein n=1 Tax=Streptomyces liliifuscus TaxID=2797636 RepID=A0A7T7RFU7_9ACTN|nr:hypothetical protein [Streptomyces liliifuscus]QQM45103.1 hypothetical protein JEQ17_40710 [Streptomyces liliifuscus]
MPQSSQTPTERKTVEELAIELLTTGKSMTHGEQDARRLLDELRKVWLKDASAAVLESSYGEPLRDAHTAKMQVYGLLNRLAGESGEVRPPSRFHATPAEVDEFVRRHIAKDVHLNYQRAIGNRAVEEAAKDMRMTAAKLDVALGAQTETASTVRNAAAGIDPLKGGGPYPSNLIRFGETGGTR